MISMASRDVFGGYTCAAFSTKNIPVVVAVMISPSLIEFLMNAFSQIKATRLCTLHFIIISKACCVVLVFL